MPQSYLFPYFPDYERWARFTDLPCDGCQGTPCLDGICFDQSSDLQAVCVSCLVSGRIIDSLPDGLPIRFRSSVERMHAEWTEAQITHHVQERLERLTRTPPIPWVQNNEWVFCGDDFAHYLGEQTQEDLNAMAPDGNGLAYLAQLIDAPETVGDWHNL